MQLSSVLYLRDFELTEADIGSLAPILHDFDYYFVITIWPVVPAERPKLDGVCHIASHKAPMFSEADKDFDLWSIGFHLRKAKTRQVVEYLKSLKNCIAGLASVAGDKQLAGQDIGIYNCPAADVRDVGIHSSTFMAEVERIAKYTLTSNRFGNLSYPPEYQNVTAPMDSEDREKPDASVSNMSFNEIIYEFGEGEPSRSRSSSAMRFLASSWRTFPLIRDMSDTGAYNGDFYWHEEGTVVTVGRFDPIGGMRICTSVSAYPLVGSLGIQIYNEDKRNLFVLAYEPATVCRQAKGEIRTLPLPGTDPFIMPKHVLITFSHR